MQAKCYVLKFAAILRCSEVFIGYREGFLYSSEFALLQWYYHQQIVMLSKQSFILKRVQTCSLFVTIILLSELVGTSIINKLMRTF